MSKVKTPKTAASETTHEPRHDQPAIPGVENNPNPNANDSGTYSLNGAGVDDTKTNPEAPTASAPEPTATATPTDTPTSGTDALADKVTAKAKKNKAKAQAAKTESAEELAKAKLEERRVAALTAGWKPEAPVMVKLDNRAGDEPNAITLDKRLQFRALGKEMVKKDVATEYANVMKDYDERVKAGEITEADPCRGFKPLKAVRITPEEAKELKCPTCIVVFDGFHTAEAAKMNGYVEWPVEIQDGTFAFARLLALGANRSHGLSRSDEDKKKGFYTLIDDPHLFKDALELAKTGGTGREGGQGGLNRALSFVGGISKGAVSKYLAQRGLTTRGDKIVKLPASKNPPAPDKDEKDKGKTNTSEKAKEQEIKANTPIEHLEAIERLQASIERHVGELIARDDAFDVVLACAKEHGIPFDVSEKNEDGKVTPVYNWSIMSSLTLMLESAKAVLEARANPIK